MGMRDLKEPGPNERQSCTYSEAIYSLRGKYPIGASLTLAIIYGRDELTVREDLIRGMT
jgi:hypothetical protein